MSFTSVLSQIGKDVEKGLLFLLPWAQGAGEVAVSIFAPSLGPLFNQTVNIVATVEQKYAALGKQTGTGASKLADALQIGEALIAQGLKIAGKDSSTAAVTNYINGVVAVLNAAPSQAAKS